LQYSDLKRLKFLTRCIHETLRLFPSVPNGTFRQLQYDDQIKGRDGKMVTLPKGTHINISVWNLHNNDRLWGKDVGEFNPDREFLPEEIFYNDGLRASNPESYRYSPFTIQPRACIGQPFASMEARVILAHMLHTFNIELEGDTKRVAESGKDREYETNFFQNNGTMSPKRGVYVKLAPRRKF